MGFQTKLLQEYNVQGTHRYNFKIREKEENLENEVMMFLQKLSGVVLVSLTHSSM